jgi:6-phosphogluconolactonase
MSPEITVRSFTDRTQLIAALAERVATAITAAGEEPRAIMLSGGSTPLPAYRAVAARPGLKVGAHLTVLYSDERYVPSSSADSNYHQTQVLLDRLALPEEQVLRVRTELTLEEAAADYERRIASLLAAGARIGLGLLGLGADGHSASLFRMPDLERAAGRLALAVHRPDGRDAVSVTPQLLEQIGAPLFVLAGADKRTALAAFLNRSADSVAYRAVSGCASVQVWTDREASP